MSNVIQEEELRSLKRGDLQKVAKENGVKANLKSVDIISELLKKWHTSTVPFPCEGDEGAASSPGGDESVIIEDDEKLSPSKRGEIYRKSRISAASSRGSRVSTFSRDEDSLPGDEGLAGESRRASGASFASDAASNAPFSSRPDDLILRLERRLPNMTQAGGSKLCIFPPSPTRQGPNVEKAKVQKGKTALSAFLEREREGEAEAMEALLRVTGPKAQSPSAVEADNLEKEAMRRRHQEFLESFPDITTWIDEMDSEADEIDRLAQELGEWARSAKEKVQDIRKYHQDILEQLSLSQESVIDCNTSGEVEGDSLEPTGGLDSSPGVASSTGYDGKVVNATKSPRKRTWSELDAETDESIDYPDSKRLREDSDPSSDR